MEGSPPATADAESDGFASERGLVEPVAGVPVGEGVAQALAPLRFPPGSRLSCGEGAAALAMPPSRGLHPNVFEAGGRDERSSGAGCDGGRGGGIAAFEPKGCVVTQVDVPSRGGGGLHVGEVIPELGVGIVVVGDWGGAQARLFQKASLSLSSSAVVFPCPLAR